MHSTLNQIELHAPPGRGGAFHAAASAQRAAAFAAVSISAATDFGSET